MDKGLDLYQNTILFFGGTGSLGYEFVKRFLPNNTIYVYSRDECKQWQMRIDFAHNPNLHFIIGDIADSQRVKESLLRVNPHIVIMAAAMKHIDQCESNTHSSLKTNLMGTKTVLDSVEEYVKSLTNLKTVLFVSSDKACSPINNYGMCKAISETLIIEKSALKHLSSIKFVNIRYGNVLNSRGSIIPLMHQIGKNICAKEFTLTHPDMTRFVMTLEQSVDLILYAIIRGDSGDTVVPKLVSMRVQDLLEIFSEKYCKPLKLIGLKPGEKLLESLINETQSARIVRNGDYTHIRSVFSKDLPENCDKIMDYNSHLNPLSKTELREYLEKLGLL